MNHKITASFIATFLFLSPSLAGAETTFSRILLIGMKGDDVKTLQTILAADKKIYPEGLVTGYYGDLTVAAVKRFQKKNGLEVLGGVGPRTMAKLMEQSGAPVLGVTVINSPIIELASTTTAHTGTFSWKTTVPTKSKVWFGAPGPLDLSSNYLKTVDYTLEHSATFSGLATSTVYSFVINAIDEKGNSSTSTEHTFTTTAQ